MIDPIKVILKELNFIETEDIFPSIQTWAKDYGGYLLNVIQTNIIQSSDDTNGYVRYGAQIKTIDNIIFIPSEIDEYWLINFDKINNPDVDIEKLENNLKQNSKTYKYFKEKGLI